jgi:hypothetical protein
MNDVVRVEGWHHATPVIVFVRKGRGMTSITGEKVSSDQIVAAFERAAAATGIDVAHYRAQADAERGRYVFKAECGDAASEEELRRFLDHLERSLADLNLEYAAKRKSQRLNPPVFLAMKRGWHEHFKTSALADPRRLFQAKTIILSDAADHGEKAFVVQEVGLDESEEPAHPVDVAAD